jgi:hypothetical protein
MCRQFLNILVRKTIIELADLNNLLAFANLKRATTYAIVLLVEIAEAIENRVHEIIALLVGMTHDAWSSMAGNVDTLHLGDWGRIRECSEELMADFARGVVDDRSPAHTEGITARFVC